MAKTEIDLGRRVRRLRIICLLAWFMASLLPVAASFWPDLRLGSWPLSFWLAAQGCMLVYLVLIVLYAGLVNRWERMAGMPSDAQTPSH